TPILEELRNRALPAAAEHWQLADIQAGAIHITPALQEQHTPQVLNYDLHGLVDFRKGCYTGQEIVARMHYRGTAKRRLQRLEMPASLLGQLTQTGGPALELVAAASTADGQAANIGAEMLSGASVQTVSSDTAQKAEALVILPTDIVESPD